jgi:lysophospholipase L1-like esterase
MPLPRKSLERAAGLLLAGTALVLVMTCVGSGRLEPGPGRPPEAPVPAGPTPAKSSGSPPAAPSVAQGQSAARDRLGHFHQLLAQLGRGERKEHVRVLWLGDSHTAADYWPEAVRQRLAERFPSGGPGFVRLGVSPYRHAKVTEAVKGRWAREPGNPATRTRYGDGVFGFAGMRAIPRGPDAFVRVGLASGAIRGGTHWDLVYRLPTARSRFRVALDGGPPRLVDAGELTGPAVQHLELTGSIDGELVLDGTAGAPEFLGVIVESSQPGVVVDSVGMDGARAAAVLAWDEPAFVEQVRRRGPVLAMLAFGTNEVVAPEAPERFGADFRGIVERLRRAVPELECVLLGPTPLEEHGRTHPRVGAIDRMEARAADELGCSYFSPYQAMGGEGGYTRWSAESPPLTARDGVHLSPAGYARLGGLVVEHLLQGLGAP